ncbi:unnamed protein product [Oikopleura dioica]|uniref:Uncharacterized protein n=1 Tax=Oikopleura dioica TaxID=34765 RepID=E4YW32_OIKDI|nr:unnamed protein product [Oikopleura dioica]
MLGGNVLGTVDSSADDESTVVEIVNPPEPKPQPSLQIDIEVDELGNSRGITVFGSTINRPRFKKPDSPRPAVRVSDRFQLVENTVIKKKQEFPAACPKPAERKTFERKNSERKPDRQRQNTANNTHRVDADPFGMELAPSAKPAVLGLNDLSAVRICNFSPRKAFKDCKYPDEKTRQEVKKNGLLFKMVTRRTYCIEGAPFQCFKGESVTQDIVPLSWDGELELEKKTSSVQNYLSRC